jgi:hypothetical protein
MKEKLIKYLKKNKISEDRYSIYEGIKSDCTIIEKWGEIWKIFYVDERGGQHILDYSDNEIEAFEKFKNFVMKS